MTNPIRLIIADDHALFRGGLKSLLRRQRDMQVVAEVESAAALMAALDNTSCDILLFDLQMERWALDDIGQLATRVKVLVLTASESMENSMAVLTDEQKTKWKEMTGAPFEVKFEQRQRRGGAGGGGNPPPGR